VPGQIPVLAGEHVAPPWARSSDGAFRYPADGSIVQVATLTARASVTGGGASVRAGTDLTQLSLFGGEITADAVVARATAVLAGSSGSADFGRSSLTNLAILGSPSLRRRSFASARRLGSRHPAGRGAAARQEPPDTDVPRLGHGARRLARRAARRASHGHADPDRLRRRACLSRAREHLAAGSNAERPVDATHPPGGEPDPDAVRHPERSRPLPGLDAAPPLQSSITSQGYVFPVFGPSGYGDTFGAPRSDVPGGWHHGDDIFAPLGAPLLAVANGTVFSVGHEKIGGNRLWLQDKAGKPVLLRAPLAYTPLARNGTQVKAGDVLGFVGNTGDAAGGAYHLHFEVHPASLLFLGYDGAVDPTPYLDAWRRLLDVHFPAGVAWAPQRSTACCRHRERCCCRAPTSRRRAASTLARSSRRLRPLPATRSWAGHTPRPAEPARSARPLEKTAC